jgi:hypothetical protein
MPAAVTVLVESWIEFSGRFGVVWGCQKKKKKKITRGEGQMSKPGPAVVLLAFQLSLRVPAGSHIDLSGDLSWETELTPVPGTQA